MLKCESSVHGGHRSHRAAGGSSTSPPVCPWLGGQQRPHIAPRAVWMVPPWLGCDYWAVCCGLGHPSDLKAENYSQFLLFTGRVVGLRVLSMLKIFTVLFGSSPALFCLTFSTTANHSEILYISSWFTHYLLESWILSSLGAKSCCRLRPIPL